ncbi:MAG: hypothetical protein CNLJKLNK_00740 [Holosporales bacterium]
MRDSLKSSTSNQDGQIRALQRSVSALTTSCQRLEKENDDLRRRLADQDSKIKSMQRELEERFRSFLTQRNKKETEEITEMKSIYELLKKENAELMMRMNIQHQEIDSLKEKLSQDRIASPTSTKQDSLASTVRLDSPLQSEQDITPPVAAAAAPVAAARPPMPSIVKKVAALPPIPSTIEKYAESIITKIRQKIALTPEEAAVWANALKDTETTFSLNPTAFIMANSAKNEGFQQNLNCLAHIIEAEFLRRGTFEYAIRLLETGKHVKDVSISVTTLIFSRLNDENFNLCYEKNPEAFLKSLDLFQEKLQEIFRNFHPNDTRFFLQILYKGMFNLEKSQKLPLTKYKVVLRENHDKTLTLFHDKQGVIIENIKKYISKTFSPDSIFIHYYFKKLIQG